MYRLLCVVFALALLAPDAVRAQEAPLVVLVVRHAETALGGTDPGLSVAGAARAAALAELAVVAGVGEGGVYASQFRRTQETAAAVVASAGGEVVTVPVDRSRVAAYPSDLVERIRRDHHGGTVLIVSHSNLVPAIVAALGAPMPAPIDEMTYDRLFVVVMDGDGSARVVSAQYGEG